jgi:hypothetical protein
VTDEIVLDAARTAALVAPAVDRLRMAVMAKALVLGGSAMAATGLDRDRLMALGLMRNLDDRPLPPQGLQAVLAYRPADLVAADTAELLARGFLVQAEEGLRLSTTGRAFQDDVHRFSQQAADELWPPDRVAAVHDLAGRALDAAAADGGPAFAITAPVGRREGASPAAVLGERLTGLRFHRYDAHVAAWRAAGLTAEEVAGLEGPQRDAVEAETNRRAATPYAALDADERLALLAGLAALPG